MKRFLCLALLILPAILILTGCAATENAIDRAERGMDMAGDAIEGILDPRMGGDGDTRASMLTKKEAEDIALGQAGISRDEAENIRTEYECDGGDGCYEIEFYHNGVEYDVKVNDDDCNIISFDKG